MYTFFSLFSLDFLKRKVLNDKERRRGFFLRGHTTERNGVFFFNIYYYIFPNSWLGFKKNFLSKAFKISYNQKQHLDLYLQLVLLRLIVSRDAFSLSYDFSRFFEWKLRKKSEIKKIVKKYTKSFSKHMNGLENSQYLFLKLK